MKHLIVALALLAASLSGLAIAPSHADAMTASCADVYDAPFTPVIYAGSVAYGGQVSCGNYRLDRAMQVCIQGTIYAEQRCVYQTGFQNFYVNTSAVSCPTNWQHGYRTWLWFRDYDGSTYSKYTATRYGYWALC